MTVERDDHRLMYLYRQAYQEIGIRRWDNAQNRLERLEKEFPGLNYSGSKEWFQLSINLSDLRIEKKLAEAANQNYVDYLQVLLSTWYIEACTAFRKQVQAVLVEDCNNE